VGDSERAGAAPAILIADDDPVSRELLSALLAEESICVRAVGTGLEAIHEAEREAPDVILMDVLMPEMGGFEACRRLKANPALAHVPIILVTMLSESEQVVRGLESGADDFVTKPISGPELRARVRSMLRLKRQHDDLRTAIRLRDDLASMIVHDMRSPLMTILVYAEAMRAQRGPPDHRYIEAIITSGQELQNYTNELLILSKIEHGHLALQLTPVDIAELLDGAASGLALIAAEREVTLKLASPPRGELVIAGDAKLLRRVLDNLLSNALKFSPFHGAITLSAETAGEGPGRVVQLRVIDEGPGIDEALWGSIFEKFAAVSGGFDDGPSVGLGLYFCRLVVEAHGGQISVGRNTPAGSVFCVELRAS
jgi:signal transduction histidine kinase